MSQNATRREFLKSAAMTTAAVGMIGLNPAPRMLWAQDAKAMKILVLGGTGQTGPHLVTQLLERGHEVTLFNRGKRSKELFPDVECIIGDRNLDVAGGLTDLETAVADGRKWDLCIDIWPHIPKIVENTATLLQGSVEWFMYVSSISVYTDNATPNADETAAVGEAPDADEVEFTWDLFGPFKAECENRVRRLYPDNHTVIRPGLIVGPRDSSYRGGYWPVRVRKGGEILAPGDGGTHIQMIDGRDLTLFEVKCMEERIGGTFNCTGPKEALTMKAYLEACKKATGSDAEFTWVDEGFLEEQEIGGWMNLPCWLPEEGEYAGFGQRNIDTALAAGMTFRQLKETILDTLAWIDDLPEERRETLMTGRGVGLSEEREQKALEAWHAEHG